MECGQCRCNAGWVGPGAEAECGRDEDGDGWSDVALPSCNVTQCRQDNCLGKGNPCQEDQDGNGVGDACEVFI